MNTQTQNTTIPFTIKKSKVKSVSFKKEWNGRDGVMYDFNIEFENGDKGVYATNQKEQTAFKEGVETDYSVESKIRGNFTDIVIKYVSQKSLVGNKKPMFEKNYKLDFISPAASYTKDLVVAEIITMKDFKKTFNDIYSAMIEKLDQK